MKQIRVLLAEDDVLIATDLACDLCLVECRTAGWFQLSGRETAQGA
ncbi:MAG: hypothetical protein WBA02_10825 [Jannaschia helgolandensis]|nr:hypothetical protein [Jannaschia helgolandensis]